MPLSREDLRQRLEFDYRVATSMTCPVMSLQAYRSGDDLKARRNPLTSAIEGANATHYLAEYQVKTLIGPDLFSDRTVVHFDLLANGDYPFSEPSCWVLSSSLPWSPHFKLGSPICIGELWRDARGKILLGHLLVHVARLLNFDEVARGGGYVGWNGEAISYWRRKLNEQPITPGLSYPVLPTDITHGDGEGNPGQPRFAAKNARGTQKGVFQPRTQGTFQPKKS